MATLARADQQDWLQKYHDFKTEPPAKLRLLRNEIFARHGKSFKSKDLQVYFSSQEWYKPDPHFSDSLLSPEERDLVKELALLESSKSDSSAANLAPSKSVDTAIAPVRPNKSVAVELQLPAGTITASDITEDGNEFLFISALGAKSELRGIPLPSALPASSFAASQPVFLAKLDRSANTIAVHPLNPAIVFVLYSAPHGSRIDRIDLKDGTATVLYQVKTELKGLVIGKRPFSVRSDGILSASKKIRLFFGERQGKKADSYQVKSITEDGTAPYQLTSETKPEKPFACPPGTRSETDGNDPGCFEFPSQLVFNSALPLNMHPDGKRLLLEDDKHCVSLATFGTSWGAAQSLSDRLPCTDSAFIHPNGMNLWTWKKNTSGLTISSLPEFDSLRSMWTKVAGEYEFVSPPVWHPSGRSIIGELRKNGKNILIWAPVDLPLTDVLNAWKFGWSVEGALKFANNGAYFADTKQYYLHNVMESARYGGQPIIVTTDPYWDLESIAFEAAFMFRERSAGIQAYTRFLDGSIESLKQNPSPDADYWKKVFAVARGLVKEDDKSDAVSSSPPAEIAEEIKRVKEAKESGFDSPILKRTFDYTDCKPRAHYEGHPTLAPYFRSFKYLVSGTAYNEPNLGESFKKRLLALARVLSPTATQDAREWIGTYAPFLGYQTFNYWENPQDRRHPYRQCNSENFQPIYLFPLIWSFDNETLCNSTDDRVLNRRLPSVLDVAASLGSSQAGVALETSGAFKKYPALQAVLNKLNKRTKQFYAGAKDATFYEAWIKALRSQWEDRPQPDVFSALAKDVWPVKRLQSGLGSWTHLRHTTLLVNERPSAAEGAEGGWEPFETVEEEKPRGAVEPDPETFRQIAGLFESLAATFAASTRTDETDGLRRLLDSGRADTLSMATLAQKELENKSLTDEEYGAIQDADKKIEHSYLLMKSLNAPDGAVNLEKGMPIIADVAGKPSDGFLHTALGWPREWRVKIPFRAGGFEAVSGAVFSTYELVNPVPLTDTEWREQFLPKAKRPDWIEPFMLKQEETVR